MKKIKRENKLKTLSILIFIISIIFLISFFSISRGNSYKGEIHQVPESSIEFLYDLTYKDENGIIVYEQEIFDRIFEIIDSAENFIIADFFLFKSSEKQVHRNLAEELTSHLINKKKQNPKMPIYFTTDYLNEMNFDNRHLERLKQEGIIVKYYSPHKTKNFDEETWVNSFWKLFRGRLNHRKLIIADSKDKIVSLITSANPHDESSAHSNVAVYIEEKIWKDIYDFENGLGLIDEKEFEGFFENVSESQSGNISVQFLADNALVNSFMSEIDNTEKGESIEIMVFYLSSKKIIGKLISASERGVDIKIVLDQSINAFGKKKNGIPNKPVAEIITQKSKGKIPIRWYDSHGEQFHVKMTIIKKKNNQSIVFLGASHLVNYEVINYNSQADVKIVADRNSKLIKETEGFFERIWENKAGKYTVEYEEFRDNSVLKRLWYEIWEILKLIF